MIELNLPIQQNNFYTSTTFYLLRGFQCSMRYFLTIIYFGVLVAVLNESFLNIASWVAKGELPTVSALGTSVFYILFSFVSLSAPSMLAGLVFSILTSLLNNKKIIVILITSIACAWFNYHYLSQLSYIKSGNTYVVSSTTLVLATGGAAVFSALLALLASTVLKPIFMPLPIDELSIVAEESPAKVKKGTSITYTQTPVAYGFNLQPA